ncbi:MAG: 2-hydroxychromene-2-carboxylate isomerase [Myxococcota bacterium]
MAASRRLEFWYELASTYSYLSAMRIEKVAAAAKLEVAWRPFLLGPIFRAQGWDDSPFNLQPAKGRYMWRDVERLAEGYGLPFRRPSVFPRNGLHAARIALVAQPEGWCPDWTRAVFTAEFAHDRDIADSAVLGGLLETLGQEPHAVLGRAASDDDKAALRAQTERAQALGIFGAPSFVVGEELYWGNDRLGDAVARAALG